MEAAEPERMPGFNHGKGSDVEIAHVAQHQIVMLHHRQQARTESAILDMTLHLTLHEQLSADKIHNDVHLGTGGGAAVVRHRPERWMILRVICGSDGRSGRFGPRGGRDPGECFLTEY